MTDKENVVLKALEDPENFKEDSYARVLAIALKDCIQALKKCREWGSPAATEALKRLGL